MAIEINTSAGNTIEVTQSDGTSVTFNQETSSVSVSSPASTSVQVLEKGVKGDKGDTGPQGEVGPGVASGGSENQFLQKNSATDYDTKWSAYTLPSADGDDGQVLTTNGAATVAFAYPKTIAEDVKNVSGGPLTKGTPVHVTGSVGNLAEVIAADAATNYPAHFVLDEDLVDDAEGKGIALGFINNVDVPDASIYNEGDTVYLGASGGFTTTKPTGASNAIQNLGIIIKVNTSGNKISGIIMGAGRANDVPNIATGNIWAGNADGVATATSVAYIDIANSRVGIGTTSPSYPLDVDGGTENNVASFASTDAVAQLRVIDYSLVPFYFGVNGTNAYISPTGGTPAGGLAVTSTGRVGIGTSSPTSKLEVNGGVTASGPIDSSDATNTSITSETARFNKFGLMTNRSSLYITNYNASGSMQFGIGGVHAASTKMYLSSDGELGIGTTSPSYALDIKKDTTSILNLYRPNSSTAAASVLDFSFNTANATESVYARIRADVETNTDLAQGGDLSFHTANSGTVSEKLRITQEGNVGIGTTSPVTPLHVYSNDGFTGTPGGLTIEQNGTGDAILQFLLTSAKRWVVGIDNNNNDNFKISGTADLGTDNGLTITNSTYNVGIGTTSPSAKLDVVGLANINDGSDNVMISSGNTALTTGIDNTATGANALQSATSASYNSAFGGDALLSNSTGSSNSAFGHGALRDNTGANNTAFGTAALRNKTSGDSNSAFGVNALYNNLTGSNNIAIGRNAGYYTTGSNNALMGYYAGYGSATSTFSNTVAVGYQALQDLTTGAGNTAVGHQTALNNSTGEYNTAAGYYSMRNATSSVQFNTALGSSSARNVTGNANTAVGHEASFNGGTGNTSLGWRAGYNAVNYNVSVGYGAASNTTGTGNVVVGYNAAVGDATSNFNSTVAVGREALNSLTTGSQNTAIGYQAADELTTESSNTVIGYQALGAATSVENATGVGYKALDVSTGNYTAAVGFRSGQNSGFGSVTMGSFSGQYAAGDSNVLIGYAAGQGSSGASTFVDTTAVGHLALQDLTTGANNTAVGYQAGTDINTGDNNTVFGFQSGQSITTANHNSLFGRQAGQDVTGANNVGMGSLALADCVSSNNNVAIGYGAARGTSGSAAPNNTVAIGYESLRNVTTANTNVVIGRSSGYSITTGGNNVLLGHESGYSLVGGASNVMLGYQAGYNETGSNKLYIANSNTATPLIYGDFNLGEITINGDLNVSGGNLKADAIEISGRAMTSPATGEYGSGSKLVTQFATGTVTAGKVYVANAGAWAEGDADAGSTSIGMIAVATDAASATEMLIEGTVKLSSNTGFSGASAGDVLYLSTTAGELTTTAPSAAGDYVRVCGYVVSASTNEVFFSPSRDWTAL